MGGRVSKPIDSRTIVAPAAAFTMALVLLAYTRTSIRAAKANAQRHRDADTGGQGSSLLAEHRRRQLGKQLLGGDKKEGSAEGASEDAEDQMSKLLHMKAERKGGAGEEK